jgi:hypothetical protein
VAEHPIEPGKIVERAIDSLRTMPVVDAEAVARVVAAAARTRAQDAAPHEDDLLPLSVGEPARVDRRFALAAAAIILVAVGAFSLWRFRPAASDGVVVGRNPVGAATPVVPVNNDAADAAPVPTQFVFDGRAHRVALVGDFNNWDDRATPLVREPGSTLWSVTLPIQRGRHIYAFLVDSVWTVDKRAPVARDPDFGVTGSVILVGRP